MEKIIKSIDGKSPEEWASGLTGELEKLVESKKPKKSVSPWVARHKQLCKELHETYIYKDKMYGSSFHDTYRDLGIISAITRMSDKWNRITNLAKNPNLNNKEESLIDSLMDLSNYCLMTVIEVEQDEKNRS